MATFNRDTFMSTYNRNQVWSLMDSYIYYLSKRTSSAKAYGKLIQSCKYFLIQNPPIVVNELNLVQRDDELDVAFDKKPVDLNIVPPKVCLINGFQIFSMPHPTESLSAVTPKIFQSNITELTLQKQICSINHLKFLGTKCERIHFYETVVMNENGAIVAFEDVFQLFPNSKTFSIRFGKLGSMMVTSKTFQALVKIPYFPKLIRLYMYELPESFDLNGFYTYMKTNKKTKIFISFGNEVSDEYRTHLQAIVDEIRAADSHDYKLPIIMFPGLE